MENASKALLIAGAILIAILLIAIGMMVFNSAKGVIDTSTSNMSDTEKTAFNSQFEIYNGTQSGTIVNTIISKVNSNNSGDNAKIAISSTGTQVIKNKTNGATTTDQIEGISIQKQAQYNVQFEDSNGDGVIDTLSITAHT